MMQRTWGLRDTGARRIRLLDDDVASCQRHREGAVSRGDVQTISASCSRFGRQAPSSASSWSAFPADAKSLPDMTARQSTPASGIREPASSSLRFGRSAPSSGGTVTAASPIPSRLSQRRMSPAITAAPSRI